jgi:hypothetical protein
MFAIVGIPSTDVETWQAPLDNTTTLLLLLLLLMTLLPASQTSQPQSEETPPWPRRTP